MRKEIEARAAQKAANQPLWLQPAHGDTVDMKVPVEHIKEKITSIVIHSAKVVMGQGKNKSNSAHFRIFLQLSGGTSVELDSYGLQGTKTKLKITYRTFKFSTTATKMDILAIPITKEFTVLEVVNLLLTNNRDRYVLDGVTGSGCRHWCKVVILDFIQRGWVAAAKANCVEELTTVVKAKFPDVNIPVPAPQGTFY